MKAEQIIALIREKIEGCELIERGADQRFLEAKDEAGREQVVFENHINTAQLLVLEGILNEVLGTESA